VIEVHLLTNQMWSVGLEIWHLSEGGDGVWTVDRHPSSGCLQSRSFDEKRSGSTGYDVQVREIISGHAKLNFALLLRGRLTNRNRRVYNKKKVRFLFREPYLNRAGLPKVTISKPERT